MRAILTRHARRALVRRLASPGWPSLATPTSRSLPLHLQCHGRRICRRFFITSLFQKPPREIRATEYEPGWMQIMIWRSRVLDNLQPPPRTELHKAWTQLMLYKISVQRPLNDTQISQCHRLFEYLWSPEEKSKDSLNELDMAIKVLGIMSHTAWSIDETLRQPNRRQAAFARAILAWVESAMPNGGWGDQDINPVRLVTMLCQSGEVDEALRLIRDWPWSSDALMHQAAAIIPSYLTLLEDAPKLAQLQDVLKEKSADPNFLWKKMTTLYARYDQVDETLSCAKAATARLPLARWSRSDLYEMARFAVRNQQERWMEDLLSESPGQTNSKAFWVETVCRPFLLNGSWKDAKAAIEKLWEEGHGGKFQAHAWLELAREESDEQLANEVTAYAASQGIAPNERDYLEWLLLKLDKKHLEGAKFSYERLRDVETFSASKAREWAKYQVALNRLLCLSCSQTTPDFTYITQVLEHVDEVQAYLEPETIAKLSLRFLENEQYLDAMDLLAVHAFKLGESDRQIVQNAFASFCKDPLISTGRAWSAYQVLEQYFPDLECPERVELMEEFFRRKRSDMALAVFAAMRNHRSPAYRPDEKVYRQCFEGFARNPDLESTERVHAWLKTDQSITPSTTLFTALMLAYTAAERPLVALDFWKEITTCKEGPGYGSLAAVFWALEQRSDGAKMARDIWTRIETMDIEVPTYVYSSYAGAIAASGQILEVQKVINNMASYVGTPPEPLTLGIAHNALPSRELQVEFEEWAKSKYRVQWSELAKTGRRMNEFGLCQFKIQRRLKA